MSHRVLSKFLSKLREFAVTALQSCYLSIYYYLENDLTICASACAFGFLFSFIPVIFMIIAVLISFVHASPEVLKNFLSLAPFYKEFFSVDQAVAAINKVTGSGIFEILVIVSIFWMARRFFAAVMLSMKKIFHGVVKNRPVISQVLILAGEILCVLFMVTGIIIFASAKTILTFPIFGFLETYFPKFYSDFFQNLVYVVPYLLCWFLIAVVYRVASGTKPRRHLCIFSAFCCTGLFWITVRIMGMFLNINRYNLVYGVLSRLIVLLLEVYIFFIYILFFAQFIYVIQYLNNLLLGELYLLPKQSKKGFFSVLKRKLFINPNYIINHESDNFRSFEKGKIIFTEQEVSDAVYYIVSGSVQLSRGSQVSIREKGQFFGETGCIFSVPRKGEATALTDCKLLRISAEKFWELIDTNPRITGKALSDTSDYFRNLYGRNSAFLL
ncbi:MAG: YihY/virulence factor BrkB family protein [Treponema sp.]|nr:YihY/virulence factor BrkB family protein [Treponema sp.]